MSELITGPYGFTNDTQTALMKQTGAGTAYTAGDLVALEHTDGGASGLNAVVAASAANGKSTAYGVVTKDVLATDDIPVLLRGITTIKYDNVGGAVTRATPSLMPAILDAGIVDAVSSTVGIPTATVAQVVALYVGDGTEPAADGIITVMFDGLGGFGAALL